MMEHLWGVAECAEFLGISSSTLRKWQARHAIPFVKLAGSIRFRPEQIRQWVEENSVSPT